MATPLDHQLAFVLIATAALVIAVIYLWK